tara:strand:+ start:27460 stop:28092 length:633 start_codon:yes stop_codon:yes gene_type:complete
MNSNKALIKKVSENLGDSIASYNAVNIFYLLDCFEKNWLRYTFKWAEDKIECNDLVIGFLNRNTGKCDGIDESSECRIHTFTCLIKKLNNSEIKNYANVAFKIREEDANPKRPEEIQKVVPHINSLDRVKSVIEALYKDYGIKKCNCDFCGFFSVYKKISPLLSFRDRGLFMKYIDKIEHDSEDLEWMQHKAREGKDIYIDGKTYVLKND